MTGERRGIDRARTSPDGSSASVWPTSGRTWGWTPRFLPRSPTDLAKVGSPRLARSSAESDPLERDVAGIPAASKVADPASSSFTPGPRLTGCP